MLTLSLFTNAFSYCLPPIEAEKWVWSERMAEFIRALGYGGVEVSAKRHLDVERVLSGGASNVRGIAEKSGLEIVALSSHFNHLDADKERRRSFNQRFLRVVEAASLLDVPVVVTFSGMPVPLDYLYPYPESNIDKVEGAWSEFRAVWGPLLDFAAQHDVKVAVEPHYGQLVFNTQTISRMFKELDHRALGINFDPSHLAWQLIDPVVVVEKFSEKIFHTHLKDVEFNEGVLRENGVFSVGKWSSAERSWRFRVPGKGVIRWSEVLGSLVALGYRGALSFEHEDPLMGLEEGAREACVFISELLAKLDA